MDLATCRVMIWDTRFMLREHFVCGGIIYVSRVCNSIVHDLAKIAMSWDPVNSMFGQTPPRILNALVTHHLVEPVLPIERSQPKCEFERAQGKKSHANKRYQI